MKRTQPLIRVMMLPQTQNVLFPQSSNSKYCHEHFSLKAIEYVSHKLFLNCAQFGNALKSLRSCICSKSIEIYVKFCFCEVLLNI